MSLVLLRLKEQIINEVNKQKSDVVDESTVGRLPPKKRIRGGKQISFRKKKKSTKPMFISKAAARKRAKKSARSKRAIIHKIVKKQKKSFKKGRRLGLY